MDPKSTPKNGTPAPQSAPPAPAAPSVATVLAAFPAPARARSAIHSPCAVVRGMCETLLAAGTYSRESVIARSVALGVDPSTASTQEYQWRRAHPGVAGGSRAALRNLSPEALRALVAALEAAPKGK